MSSNSSSIESMNEITDLTGSEVGAVTEVDYSEAVVEDTVDTSSELLDTTSGLEDATSTSDAGDGGLLDAVDDSITDLSGLSEADVNLDITATPVESLDSITDVSNEATDLGVDLTVTAEDSITDLSSLSEADTNLDITATPVESLDSITDAANEGTDLAAELTADNGGDITDTDLSSADESGDITGLESDPEQRQI